MNKIIFILSVLIYTQLSYSQKRETFNEVDQSLLVSKIGQSLIQNYIFEELALEMKESIDKQYKSKVYSKIVDPVQFAAIINKSLNEVYVDKHLYVEYNPMLATALIESDKEEQEEKEEEDAICTYRAINYGCSTVEILYGNIGYLNLTSFVSDNEEGFKTIASAFTFLQYTNALIIDLRTNTGGSPDAVAAISSFFFEKKVHLNDSFDRSLNKLTEYWTMPEKANVILTIPIYILVSDKTFSAAEEFAYNLQKLSRATIVGERTAGGAHNTFVKPLSNDFVMYIPYGRAINPITKTNWEKVGVQPDIEVASESALEIATTKIIENLLLTTTDEDELFNLTWQLDLLKAKYSLLHFDVETLNKYAGVYDDKIITLEKGKLFYQRIGKPKFELEPMKSNFMKPKGNNYFKIEFVADSTKNIQHIIVYYKDNRQEKSSRK